MNIKNKATQINLFSLQTPQMRAFHMTWVAFFLCFFSWFGIAPLMPIVRTDLGLTKAQIGNTIIASVAITILARLITGWVCDRVGPRRTYSWLLIFGALPVMGIGLAHDYTTFLLFRLAIGAIGASFVITQFHASLMFAPNIVGTANAITAGWGNLGGGVTQVVMPLILAGFIWLGASETLGWRLAMVVPGVVLLLAGVAYYRFTVDAPNGNFRHLRRTGEIESVAQSKGLFWQACQDRRVWMLALVYAASFGVELIIDNIAALYFFDYFGLSVGMAGVVAGCFGLMNLFARPLGGILSDRIMRAYGLRGRVLLLFSVVLLEGLALMLFSQMTALPLALLLLVITSLFVKMSNGATYAVVPFVNPRALGSVAGIVGAGGNLGAMLFGFLFKAEALTWPTALLILGGIVTVLAFGALVVRFPATAENATIAESATRLPVTKPTSALAGAGSD